MNLSSNQVVYADGDFDPASNIVQEVPEVAHPPPRPLPASSKLSSEHFGLPEGVNVLHFFVPCCLVGGIKYRF